MDTRNAFRRGWAIIAAILSSLAVGYELVTGICKLLFDPLPDGWCITAYIYLIVMLLVNEYLMHYAETPMLPPGYEAKLTFALRGTYVAVIIAAIYSVLFVPALPYSFLALFMYGVGVGAWTPFINLVVLLCQMGALKEQRRFHKLGPVINRQAISRQAIGMCAFVLVSICVLVAIMPEERRSLIAQHAPGYRMFSSWWGFVHGEMYMKGDKS